MCDQVWPEVEAGQSQSTEPVIEKRILKSCALSLYRAKLAEPTRRLSKTICWQSITTRRTSIRCHDHIISGVTSNYDIKDHWLTACYLFYISQNYSFEILRPLQQEILSRGDKCAWYVEGKEVNTRYFTEQETVLTTIDQAIDYQPAAVFVPGNIVPNFLPGLKVHVFHGFEWKKKGHYRIRGFFDLYCTQGPFFTKDFEKLKQKHQHFDVVETGWPKTDSLFTAQPFEWPEKNQHKTILFAPTFSPSLTCVPALFDTIIEIAKHHPWQWLVKLHPKMESAWVEAFRTAQSENIHFIETDDVAPLLQAADIMISDTSSIVTEFALLNKPVITFKNSAPDEYLLNIDDPKLLVATIQRALSPTPQLLKLIKQNVAKMHPYQDGSSSARVLDATIALIKNGNKHLKSKPLNLLRSLKIRKKMGYWKF